MALDFILSLLKNKKDENILFTIKSGPVVHYSKLSARQIAESPKFRAVSGDEVIDFVVPKGNGEKVAIIELQEPLLTSNICVSPYIKHINHIITITISLKKLTRLFIS